MKMIFQLEIRVLGYQEMFFQVEFWGWEWMKVVFGV